MKALIRTMAFAGVALAAGAAQAQSDDPAAEAWRQLTRADLEAAHALVAGNHPGAVEALGDAAFRDRLTDGYDAALARIASVDSYPGYLAVLAGFATGFGDEHIWSTPRLRGLPYSWTGLVMTRRGGEWIVGSQDGEDQGLVGARLVSCDGMAAEAVAAGRLAFRISAPVEAQRVAHGGFMFVDDGNPFLTRPARCAFATGEGPIEVEMDWRPVDTSRLAAALNAGRSAARAGFGVRRSGDGWWIAMERLSDEAAAVVQTMEDRQAEWRDSPLLVIDLRGNGGGDSRPGRRLADLIYGADHTAARLGHGTACAVLWRASPGNAAHVRAFAAKAQTPDAAAYYEALAVAIDEAVAEGRPFDEPIPECESADPVAGPAPEPAYAGQVVIVTDHACFSSCLLMVRDFRALGALHVGEATNAATRYMEVREIELPSGLSTFSTLQKVVIGEDADIGPFVPEQVFPGAMSDTAALEDWIADLVAAP